MNLNVTESVSMETDGMKNLVAIETTTVLAPDNPGEISAATEAKLAFARELRFYVTPIIAIAGIVFNLLAVIVFCNRRMRKTTSAHYLTALAVSDSLMLLSELIKWLDSPTVGPPTISASYGLCKLTYHIRYASQLLSAFLVTTVSIERYIVVVHPLRAASVLSLKVARVNILVETAVAIILGSYGSIIFVPKMVRTGMRCTSTNDTPTYRIMNLVVSKGLGELFASTVVILMTSVVIIHLLRARSYRLKQLAVGNDKAATTSTAEQQLTVMLVVVATMFVCLRVPYTISWYLSHYATGMHPDAKRKLTILVNYTYIFNLLNYAVNFFLYSVSGSRFRTTMAAICSRPILKGRDVTSGSGTGRGHAAVARDDDMTSTYSEDKTTVSSVDLADVKPKVSMYPEDGGGTP